MEGYAELEYQNKINHLMLCVDGEGELYECETGFDKNAYLESLNHLGDDGKDRAQFYSDAKLRLLDILNWSLYFGKSNWSNNLTIPKSQKFYSSGETQIMKGNHDDGEYYFEFSDGVLNGTIESNKSTLDLNVLFSKTSDSKFIVDRVQHSVANGSDSTFTKFLYKYSVSRINDTIPIKK